MNAQTQAVDVFHRGALVQTLWDTGAFGLDICYGQVIASGEKTITIRWASGNVNRIKRDQYLVRDVKPAVDADEARAVIARAGGAA